MGFWADGCESYWNCDYLVCEDPDWYDEYDEDEAIEEYLDEFARRYGGSE